MLRKIAIVMLCSMVLIFSVQQKQANAAGALAALPAAGAGAYTVGAFALAGLVGAFGYAEYSDVINSHAKKVWNTTSESLRNSFYDSIESSQGQFEKLVFVGSVGYNIVRDLSRIVSKNAIAHIEYLKLRASNAWTTVSGYLGQPLDTQFPEAVRTFGGPPTLAVSFTFPSDSPHYFVVSFNNDRAPILAKTVTLNPGTGTMRITFEDIHTATRFRDPEHIFLFDFDTSDWGKFYMYNGIYTVEDAIGFVNGNGSIHDIYIGTESLLTDYFLVLQNEFISGLEHALNDPFSNGLVLPNLEGKLGVALPDQDLPVGADIYWNPTLGKWTTKDGTPLTLNPSDVNVAPFPDAQVIDHPVTGVPTLVFETPYGYVNIVTGEIVGNPSIPGNPDVPYPPPVELSPPTRKLDFTPLLMTGDLFTRKFPFSIPWDLKNQFSVFNVTNETPVFTIDKENFIVIGNKNIPFKMDISLETFDSIATATRWFFLIAFDVAIILLMRRLMPE